MTNPEGLEPTWRDHIHALFAKREGDYGRVEFQRLPADVPEEVLSEIEKLMREHRFQEEVEAKKEAIRWWGDYKERRLGK